MRGAIASPWVVYATANVGAPPVRDNLTVAGYLGLCLAEALAAGTTLGIRRRQVFDRVVSGSCSLLDSRAPTVPIRQGAFAEPITDPLRGQRNDLAMLAVTISDAAWALDARQVRGSTPHPVSTLLRAVSEHLRAFLHSNRSWCDSIPDDVTELLQSAVLLLAMPGDADAYEDLAGRVTAFGADGQPTADPGERPPGDASRSPGAGPRRGLKGAIAVATGIATIAGIIISWALFAFHRLDIIELLRYLQSP